MEDFRSSYCAPNFLRLWISSRTRVYINHLAELILPLALKLRRPLDDESYCWQTRKTTPATQKDKNIGQSRCAAAAACSVFRTRTLPFRFPGHGQIMSAGRSYEPARTQEEAVYPT